MKRIKIYFGMALVMGLLFSVNLTKARSVKSEDMTKAQIGWGLSRYVGNYESGGAAETVTISSFSAIGAYGGAKGGAMIGSSLGPAGAVVGAGIGAL